MYLRFNYKDKNNIAFINAIPRISADSPGNDFATKLKIAKHNKSTHL